MGNLTRGQWIEGGAWVVFAILAFVFSFDFDKEIEIYRFGASGWPRAVILLIALAAVAQVFHEVRVSRTKPDAARHAEVPEVFEGKASAATHWRVAVTLALPLIYAALLEYTGFYFTTPLFIAAFLLITGERRLWWILGVTFGIYAVLVFCFGKLLYINLPVGYVRPFYDFSNWLLVLIR